jgi:DNA-directed RNA polymerase
MDTNVLPDETQGFHEELAASIRKLRKQDARATTNVGFGATLGGMTITNTYHALVTEAVAAKLSGPRPKANSNEAKLERQLRQIGAKDKEGHGAEVIALCLLQVGLSCAAGTNGGTATQREVFIAMGQALNDELWAAKLLQTNKKLAHQIGKAVKERYGSVELRKKAAKRLAEKGDAEGNNFTMEEWSRPMLLAAGNWGVNILLEAMPRVFFMTEPQGYKGERLWQITDDGMEMARAATHEMVFKHPVYQPRTERPKDWDRFVMRVNEDDRTMDRAQLLRTWHKDVVSAAKHAITSGQMAPALRALNILQSVPFTLNTWMHDIIVECYNKGIKVEGLPSKTKLEVPARLDADEFKALSVEERKLLAKTIKGLKKANRTNDSDNMLLEQDMMIALRLATVAHYHTPMNMDWRTRVYAMTQFNFQREDRVRSLFLFNNGKRIGRKGIYWLAVHVANCGAFKDEHKVGLDKKPIKEKARWVRDNLMLLTDYAKRPLANTGWTTADSPFLFLAACRELVSAIAAGPSYITQLPTSWDGACNGLQHLCAMTRAPEGKLVNLTSDPQPYDVYQVVADLAMELIQNDSDNMELFGKPDDDKPERKTTATYAKLSKLALAHGVDRKLVKRNVMTFSYSSKEFGMSEQHFEDTMEPLELKWLKKEIDAHPFGDSEDEWRLMSRYLAKRTLQAIKTVVKLPAEAMEFMQVLAKTLAHEGKPLRWTTPAGVPCINRYHESTTERVELFCYDKGVKRRSLVTIATGAEKAMAKDKCAAGVAPNVVHSLDASHLLLSVCAAADEGITDIATVHDSFGCLACDAPRFNKIIRETFLRMYEKHDIMSELYDSARHDLTEAGQERLENNLTQAGFIGVPEKGALDLKEILNARYAFA